MKKATVIAAITVMLLLALWAQGGVSMVRNGSFENDGVINFITAEDPPQYWCDVNIPSGKFGGYVDTVWSTHGNYSLTLYSEALGTFDANDMATASQQVYLADVNQIIFDIKLSTDWSAIPWDSTRSAILLIDGNIVWDSNTSLGPNADGEYLNQTVDVNQIYKDANSHVLSLGIRTNIAEEKPYIYYLAQWDFVKFDTHCGGFGYLPEDLNRDCYVDFLDFAMLAGQWLAEEPAYNCDLLADDESIVNLRDFAILASYWQDSACGPLNGCRGSDFDGSRTVDFADLMIFAEYWLEPVVALSDLNTDRVVDFKDVAIFAGGWLDNTDWENWQDDNCYEMELPAGDVDDSGEVYYGDILMLADNWLSEGKCIRADINKDDVVNFLDFAIIADEWLLRSWLYGLE
jgi:hypothetical protein